MTTAAAIYVRISDDRESDEAGVIRQEADCRALAATLGVPVGAVYADNDRGASTRSRKPRPGYDALLAAARGGQVSTILAYSSSRLTRRPREHEGQIELAEQHGVTFGFVRSPSFDLGTADGRQVARILAATDAAEAERTGERVARQARQRAELGRNHGGRRSYGFTAQGAQDPDEVAVLRRVADQVLGGISLRSIAGDLNREGVATVTGGRWTGATLRDVLCKPSAAGITVSRGVEVGRLPGDPPLPRDVWQAVRTLLTDPSRASQTGRPPSWLGTGIYRCVCGDVLDVGPRQAYRCRGLRAGAGGGGHVRRQARALDEYVAAVVVARLSRDDAAELFATRPDVDVPALRKAVNSMRATKARLATMLGTGDLDAADYATASKANAAGLAAAEAELASAVAVSPVGALVGAPDVEAAWLALSLAQQREIVRLLLTVTVLPAAARPGFDPTAIRIEPR